VTKLWFELSW